jgi:cold shock protein
VGLPTPYDICYQSKSTVLGAKPHLLPSLTPLSRETANFGCLGKKDNMMKLFGTVKSFDESKGYGSIKPEAGGDELRFEKSAVQWGNATTPKIERRFSYEVANIGGGEPRAINLLAA